MNKTIIAALAMMTLAIGPAFAVNGETSTDPQYGKYAFPNAQYHTGTVFSEIYHGIVGHGNDELASNATKTDIRGTNNAGR